MAYDNTAQRKIYFYRISSSSRIGWLSLLGGLLKLSMQDEKESGTPAALQAFDEPEDPK
jgi:hypothetical protein